MCLVKVPDEHHQVGKGILGDSGDGSAANLVLLVERPKRCDVRASTVIPSKMGTMTG